MLIANSKYRDGGGREERGILRRVSNTSAYSELSNETLQIYVAETATITATIFHFCRLSDYVSRKHHRVGAMHVRLWAIDDFFCSTFVVRAMLAA